MPSTVRVRVPLLVITLLLGLAVALAPRPVAASSHWAPEGEATITPGVQLVSDSGQCTANFIYTDGSKVYIGSAAHCTGQGGATDTNGCLAGSRPLGSQVQIEGAQHPGTLVYSSWITMQRRGETDSNACAFNDFALVEIDSRDHGRVNPTVPFWGGPDGLGGTSSFGEQVYSYGNSGLRLGIDLLKPKTGTSLGQSGGGWNHSVYTATPGIPGDSGSAFLDSQGRAMGVLVTLQIAPLAGSNGVTDLALALDYARTHGGVNPQLASGTSPFSSGSLLPLLPLVGGLFN